jgi:hypothetical protein
MSRSREDSASLPPFIKDEDTDGAAHATEADKTAIDKTNSVFLKPCNNIRRTSACISFSILVFPS